MLPGKAATRTQALASAGLAALLAAIVLLPLLGHKPLAEWDEGIYAEVSREMLSGSWLVPHWNFQPWFEKPPLALWITAVFFKLFGVSEFTARAGSAFSAIALVGLLNAWLACRRDLLTAGISTVILLATFGFVHIAHVGETDVLLSLGCMLAMIGLADLDTLRPQAWYCFWIGFGIAVMTKGAAAIVLPITAVLFALVQRLRWRHLARHFFAGLAIFLVIAVPWHLALYLRFGRQFLDEYLGLHVLTRATSQMEGHHTHWWYYLIVLIASTPPFFLLYPSAIARGLRDPSLRPFAFFTLVTAAFYTCIQTRLPHYIAPIYPALAILTAVFLRTKFQRHSGEAGISVSVLRPVPLACLTAAIWTLTILATHSTLKSLHAATLAGINLLDNREADALLKANPLPGVPGPLLVWRTGPVQSLATLVFYSRHQVILVAPASTPTPDPTRYQPAPQPLACPAGRCLLLLDSTNIPHIPAKFKFQPIASSANLTLGLLQTTH